MLASRSKANLEKVRESLQKEVPTVEVRIEELDLSSQTSMRQAANRINAYIEPIDVLINNAGIMAPPFSKTVDGFESQFGTNHLGHFLFTNLIMPRILAAKKEARIVTLSSAAHRWGGIHWTDYKFEVSWASLDVLPEQFGPDLLTHEHSILHTTLLLHKRSQSLQTLSLASHFRRSSSRVESLPSLFILEAYLTLAATCNQWL